MITFFIPVPCCFSKQPKAQTEHQASSVYPAQRPLGVGQAWELLTLIFPDHA